MSDKPDILAFKSAVQRAVEAVRPAPHRPGISTAIRDRFDAISELRAAGVSWEAIAAGLIGQNVTTATGAVVSAALVRSRFNQIQRAISRKAEKKVARQSARSSRPDVVNTNVTRSTAQPSAKVKLASDATTLNSVGPTTDDNDPAIVKSRLEEAAAQANLKFFKQGDEK